MLSTQDSSKLNLQSSLVFRPQRKGCVLQLQITYRQTWYELFDLITCIFLVCYSDNINVSIFQKNVVLLLVNSHNLVDINISKEYYIVASQEAWFCIKNNIFEWIPG